ncbi:MAG: FG-GAP repeat protein, partial [Chloroflexi bacterium]|nr:FG-GAP repeat protein [Chloroflexota bacterium]
VAVSGDAAVVGARGGDAGGSNAGAAYVFQRDEGGADNWGQVKKLTASDAQAGDGFGFSAAVSGDTAVVGALFEGAEGLQAGAAYVFQRNEGGTDNWGEVTKLTASDAQSNDRFGFSAAVSGDTLVIGAYHQDLEHGNVGKAYAFQRDEGGTDNWGEVTKLTASDAQNSDGFAYSVAVSGDTAVVGAKNEDAGGNSAGAAYVFQLKQPFPGDTDGDGCPDVRENLPKAQADQGGGRDWQDPNDFYDVAGLSGPTPDGVIDLLFDILGVIAHYSPQGASPYDAHYDRGPSAGPNPWNMTAPDGVIDLLNDILGVITQYNPTGCT